MLELLSGLLLVFIFTELISTIRVVIARRKPNSANNSSGAQLVDHL
jgi:uncharacterized membrane protein